MNQFIEEDWEMLMHLESIYVLEHKMQIEEDYWRWQEEQKPCAEIILNIPETINYESRISNRKEV